MPFYRVNGTLMHLKLGGSKRLHPHPCPGWLTLPGHETPQRCLQVSEFLCDWETGPGRTCDRPMCAQHATKVGDNLHLCPEHAARRAAMPVVQAPLL